MTKEQAYDEHVSPLMNQIIEACKAHGIAFFASFAIGDDDDDPDLHCTTHIADGEGRFDPRYVKAWRAIGSPSPLTRFLNEIDP